MKKTKISTAGLSLVKVCALGTGIAVLFQIVLAMVTALFISDEYFEMSASGYLSGASLFLSAFLGCLTAGKLVKERMVFACLAVIGSTMFVQLAAAILFFNGISSSFLLSILPMIAACVSAILLCINPKKHSGSKRRRVRSR